MVEARLIQTALSSGDPDDGEQGRQLRGLAIAALEPNIRPDKFGYKVPSQSGNGVYLVNLEHGPYCSCPDFEKRDPQPCKHVYAVQTLLQRSEHLDDRPEPPAKPVGVVIDHSWAAYDAAQINEGDVFAKLLWSLCKTVPQPEQTNGRPRLPLSEMLYAMGLKVYSTLSTRRAMSVVRDAVDAGRIGKEPSYSTAIRYFERAEVTPVIRELIQQSALPLKDIEVDFALDSSGFASHSYKRWFDHKYGANKKYNEWVKVHLMCGVRTNIVTVADATPGHSADSPFLPDFVRITAEHFNIREVSADAAYSSHKNLHAVDAVGGVPYIPFKKDAVGWAVGRKVDHLWRQMHLLFTLHQAEFDKHYHKRSNAETTFHMTKAKFGDKVRAKTDTARVNEALMKLLCHNICVLVKAMYTLGITPVFEEETFSSELPLDAKLHAA